MSTGDSVGEWGRVIGSTSLDPGGSPGRRLLLRHKNLRGCRTVGGEVPTIRLQHSLCAAPPVRAEIGEVLNISFFNIFNLINGLFN